LRARLQVAKLLLAVRDHGGVVFLLGKVDQRAGILEFSFERAASRDRVGQTGALTHDFLRFGGIIPQRGIFRALV